MKGLNINVYPLKNPKNKVVAMVSMEFGSLVLTSIRLLEGKDGSLFLGMPSFKQEDGTYKDIFFIKDKDKRKEINDLACEEYYKKIQNSDMQPIIDDSEIPF